MLSFGPVPSRRLGQSLGINNIPPKICTYSCVYCQLGRTSTIQIDRESFHKPGDLLDDIREKITKAGERQEHIDYVTVVSDGEPTLDNNLGEILDMIQKFDIKTAVITNASLLWQKDVRDNLDKADWVSVKIDAVSTKIWHIINRPHRKLDLDTVLHGILTFSHGFLGVLTTETMLIQGINDSTEELSKICRVITELDTSKSYIAVPTRPPAEPWAVPASEQSIAAAYEIFTEKSISTELLTGYEGSSFAFTGDAEQDLLSITAVHPMRKEGINRFLTKAGEGWDLIEKLINERKLVEVEYKGRYFYTRKLREVNK